jgi:hypothetical protein
VASTKGRNCPSKHSLKSAEKSCVCLIFAISGIISGERCSRKAFLDQPTALTVLYSKNSNSIPHSQLNSSRTTSDSAVVEVIFEASI